MTKENPDKCGIPITECECSKCSRMCHAPCCGTVKNIDRLIEQGYGPRLMLDDWPYGAAIIKPALKGFEGKRAPMELSTKEGCTFWKEGKCELHSLGLKPIQGKLAHHSLTDEENNKISDYLEEEWENNEDAHDVIEKWKKINEKECDKIQ